MITLKELSESRGPFLSTTFESSIKQDFIGVSCDYFHTDNHEKFLSVESFEKNKIAFGLMFRTFYLDIIGSCNSEKRVIEDQDLFSTSGLDKPYHLPIPLYNYVKNGNSKTDRVQKDQ